MRFPGYTAESGIGRPGQNYRMTGAAPSQGGLTLAQSEVFCGVCALGGFGCGQVCRDCGPFGWFTCCDSICTEPPPGFTAPAFVKE